MSLADLIRPKAPHTDPLALQQGELPQGAYPAATAPSQTSGGDLQARFPTEPDPEVSLADGRSAGVGTKPETAFPIRTVPQPADTWSTRQEPILRATGAQGVRIANADPSRRRCIIQNVGTVTVYIGRMSQSCGPTSGFPLLATAGVTLDTREEIWCSIDPAAASDSLVGILQIFDVG